MCEARARAALEEVVLRVLNPKVRARIAEIL